MKFSEFQDSANRTLPEKGKNHFFRGPVIHPIGPTRADADALESNGTNCDLLHAVLGVAGEAGELIDPVKKSMFYGKPLDVENLKEEAGDLLWYIAGPLCRALGCTLEELAAANVAKLRKRYPEKYTDEAAQAREDKALEAVRASANPGKRLRNLITITAEEKISLSERYGHLVDYGDGYFWDSESRSRQICPELWEDVPATEPVRRGPMPV